jgi:regulatory protein
LNVQYFNNFITDSQLRVIALFNQFKKKVTRDEALYKAQKYCAFRDRCVKEVEEKLKEWDISKNDSDSIIDELVESDFINENRFLLSFVRGKFNANRWGKYKIKVALREKGIDDENIDRALTKLDEKDYLKTAKLLIDRKWMELEGTESRTRKSKVYYYMISKGFEPDVVIKLMN